MQYATPFRYNPYKPFDGIDEVANAVPPVSASQVLTPEWLAFLRAEYRTAPLRVNNISVSYLEKAYALPTFVDSKGRVDYTKRNLQIDQVAQNWLHGETPREVRIVNTGRSEGKGGSPYQKVW